ncbi:DUF4388 domain-containing protein [candidate division KSB1 bacterium]|nr:DUF4388 domain-containing protein [candidate division KSB1 bacterium]
MTETLTGMIDQMSLIEILKLIHSGKMSGRLMMTNSYAKGELYVKEGEIMHCLTGSSLGETALAAMLGWIEGRFKFESGIDAPDISIDTPTTQLLKDSTQKIQDWQHIKKVVSSVHDIFVLASGTTGGNVNLAAQEWEILSQVNGSRTVGEIMELTGKDEYRVAKVLYQLSSTGLLKKLDKPLHPTTATVDKGILEAVEKNYTNIMGPMASIIMEEALEELDVTLDAFPQNKIAAFIEKISLDIKNEDQRLNFSQKMLELLKNL